MKTKQALKVVLKPQSGEYLTDETGFWRFEMFLPKNGGVIVEDAWTGTTVSWSMDEFSAMIAAGLRVVERHCSDCDRPLERTRDGMWKCKPCGVVW